jgi:hypothetical protein
MTYSSCAFVGGSLLTSSNNAESVIFLASFSKLVR